MRLKIKNVHVENGVMQDLEGRSFVPSTPEYYEFQRQIKAEANPYGVITNWYSKIFKEEPPDDKPLLLIQIKVEYELIKRGYANENIDLSPVLKLRHKAAQEFRVEGLPSLTRSFVNFQQQKQEDQMVTIKKSKSTLKREAVLKASAPVSKVRKEKVHETYFRLFESNGKAKLSDEALVKELTKVHPGKKTYKIADVRSVRSLYNCGKLPLQKGKKPIMPSIEYGKKK